MAKALFILLRHDILAASYIRVRSSKILCEIRISRVAEAKMTVADSAGLDWDMDV